MRRAPSLIKEGKEGDGININIDNRLKTIAEMIRGDIIADVGSDHAYLPIWLYFNQKIKKAYALDISEKCLDRIKANLKRYKIDENIIVPVLSDGFSRFENNFDFAEVTDVIIAGMGGETIAEILARSPAAVGVNFILQPNTKIVFLRKFLYDNKFDIIKETAAESRKRFYTVINAKYTGEIYDRL